MLLILSSAQETNKTKKALREHMKKTIVLLLIILLAAVDFVFTFLMSRELARIRDGNNVNRSTSIVWSDGVDTSDYVTIGMVTNESTVIAIVNLDEGVGYDGQLEVYSSQIIQFPENNCTYEYTSLSDAETGIVDGRYGAYIIIPATFSESIVSINATPSPCNIDYVISEAASEQGILIAGIYDLYINLNNRISYMYLANILSDFHIAQDNAATVINNDILDYNAMLAVQPTDIASTLVLSETPIPSNNTPMLDVSGCWQTMSSTVNNINTLYSNATSDINEDI